MPVFAMVFVLQTNTNAQNTPTNVTHLLSLSNGISAPFRIAVKSTGTIYITDVSQNNIVKYDKSFNLIGAFNIGIKPTALAINSSDELFVGDSETGIIYKLDGSENATEFSTVTNSASSMVFDKNNLLYVVDDKLKQVTVLDTDGIFLRAIGYGDFVQPTGITYDNINDRILVSEHGGIGDDVGGGMMGGGYPLTKVWIFDTDGNELAEIGEGGSDDGQFYRIQGMTISQNGTIYVTDPYQGQISIFENNGVFLNKFGEYGSVSGKLNFPMDVKFDSQGRVLVSSMNTGAVEVYYVNEINPTYKITAVKEVLCPGENTDIRVDFTGTAPWTFTYTKDGINPVTITDTYSDPYIFNTTEPGLFEVTSMSDANYSTVDYSNNFTVTQNPFPTSEINSGDVEICKGTNTEVSINFTGVAPYTFTYTDGTTPVTIYNNELNPYNISTSENGAFEVTYLKGGGGCVGTSLTGVANINVNALPSSIITSEDIVICEGETTDISIDFTGTAPWNFTYAIDGVDQSPIITSDNPYTLTTGTEGIYSITALSDALNTGECFTDSVNISVTPLPTSNITSNNTTICKGESSDINIELTGTPPWNLTYTIDGVNPVTITDINTSPYFLTVQKAGLYEVIALSGNSCIGTEFNGNTQLTVTPLPTAVMTDGNDQYLVLEGETMDFSLELTGESPWTYSYVIDDENAIIVTTSNSSNTITGSLEGTYEVKEISDANCTNYRSEGYPEIKYDPSPTSFISSENIIICGEGSAEVQIDLTGNAPWNITYTIDGLNPIEVLANVSPYILSVSEPGLYKVSNLSDAYLDGIQMLGEVIVSVEPLPQVNLGIDTAICQNESITLNAGSFSEYLWNNGSTAQTINVDSEGTYIVSVTDANSCESSGEIIVSINPLPIVNLGNDLSFCEGESITIDAGSFSSYLWNDGSTTQTINVNSEGAYSVSVTDANSCENSGEIIVSTNPLPSVDLGSDIAICKNETITLNAGSFSGYLWNDGSITQTIDVDSEGTYSVSVTDNNNCTNTDEITISVNPLAVSDFTFTENNLEISFTNNSLNASAYLWNFGDSNTSTDVNPVYTYSSSGEYIVSLTAINNECGDSVSNKSVTAITTSIEDTYLKNNIAIYPNPSDGFININLGNINQVGLELEIRNFAGQRVFFKKIEPNQSAEIIDLSNQPSGIYNLNIISKDWIQTKKIILSK